MKKNFVEELRWRGMIHQVMPGIEEQLSKEATTCYIGFDPTADSLHIGSLVQIMLLKHFQLCGHKPIALIGGATGMIGDPSGKAEERKLLTLEDVRYNEQCIKKQLEKFLIFEGTENSAEIVNNNDWFQNINTITFLREVGKFLTVSYLLSKGFVKDRLEQDGDMSFTEFNYILMQAYDFMWLLTEKNCKLQMGGSDQWGNITAGTELIRKKLRKEAFGITCPLITKADGGKFGKTETGNVWLDPHKTSPYKFYQFWLNVSDEDVVKYIRIFTLLSKEEIEALETQHDAAPHERILQKTLAKDVTIRVHSEHDYKSAVEATEILFKGTLDDLKKLDEKMFLEIFDGVPHYEISRSSLEGGLSLIDFLSVNTPVFTSKGEARKMLQSGGVSINKEKIHVSSNVIDEWFFSNKITAKNLINEKYILIQKGKKNYFLAKVV